MGCDSPFCPGSAGAAANMMILALSHPDELVAMPSGHGAEGGISVRHALCDHESETEWGETVVARWNALAEADGEECRPQSDDPIRRPAGQPSWACGCARSLLSRQPRGLPGVLGGALAPVKNVVVGSSYLWRDHGEVGLSSSTSTSPRGRPWCRFSMATRQ